jgi:hypothetical protein
MRFLPIFLFVVLCMSFHVASAQKPNEKKHSLGIRLVDPTGFTYKYYAPSLLAFEAGIGTVPNSWHGLYYVETFKKNYDKKFIFKSRDTKNVMYLFARVLKQNNINVDEDFKGSLQWFYGAGLVYKSANIHYTYEKNNGNVPEPGHINRHDIDFGTDVIAGVEYTLENFPLTLYTELSIFVEFTDKTTVKALGGVGARFRF